ncbi:hypothetical protein [Nocardia sp. NPDC127526]|uniref:hypothetical protein n=1 Tax=Nocardia sp. NPDC127526 TaxID=3345393 RepID=UPI0036415BBE
MTAPTGPWLPLRALVFLCVMVAAGLTAGLLGYWDIPDAATATLTGIICAGTTLMWVITVNWPNLLSIRGAVLVVVAVFLGVGLGVLTVMVVHALGAGIAAGLSVFGSALVGLEKIVY